MCPLPLKVAHTYSPAFQTFREEFRPLVPRQRHFAISNSYVFRELTFNKLSESVVLLSLFVKLPLCLRIVHHTFQQLPDEPFILRTSFYCFVRPSRSYFYLVFFLIFFNSFVFDYLFFWSPVFFAITSSNSLIYIYPLNFL